jgi:hypothetical protein
LHPERLGDGDAGRDAIEPYDQRFGLDSWVGLDHGVDSGHPFRPPLRDSPSLQKTRRQSVFRLI